MVLEYAGMFQYACPACWHFPTAASQVGWWSCRNCSYAVSLTKTYAKAIQRCAPVLQALLLLDTDFLPASTLVSEYKTPEASGRPLLAC